MKNQNVLLRGVDFLQYDVEFAGMVNGLHFEHAESNSG